MPTIQVADKPTLDAVKVDTENILKNMGSAGAVIYGVKISKSDSNPYTRVQYTHNAIGMTPAHMNYDTGAFDYGDWAKVFFVEGNYPVMLKYDGTVAYKLNPNDYTLKADGTASDYNNPSFAGNAMARIPLAYIAMYEDANYDYLEVSDVKVNDNFQAIAHTKQDGTVVNEIFLAMFAGSLVDTKLRSIAGQVHIQNKTVAQEIAAAQANNPTTRPSGDTNGWYTRTWGQRMLINAFLILMGKSTNTQLVFGNGDSSSYVDDPAQNYGMVIPGSVETMIKGGQFWGSTDTKLQQKVFHMEDWWGNQWERIAGIINNYGTFKVSFTGPYNISADGYADAGPTPVGDGYFKGCRCNKYGRVPAVMGGSSSTYDCDYTYIDPTIRSYPSVGVSNQISQIGYVGAFTITFRRWSTYTDKGRGACLSFID